MARTKNTSKEVSNLRETLKSGEVNIKEFVGKYKNLGTKEQEQVIDLLENSLTKAKSGYKDLLHSVMEVKSFMRLQEDLLEALEYDMTELEGMDGVEKTRKYTLTVKTPKLDVDDEDDTETEDAPIIDEEVDAEEVTEEALETITLKSKRERGRAPKLQELINSFNLTQKASNQEEEIERIQDMENVNEWRNISDDKTPHQVIINATYIASVQFLEANSKNANFSVLTRVMLNPSGAFFNGESVLIRNRYLETREEAEQYMDRQMKKIQKQFFYDKVPAILPNHGNKNSYYSFHLSKDNRKQYKEVCETLSK